MKMKRLINAGYYVLGCLLALLFLSPFYIVLTNSFKTQKEFLKTL